jgi:hypothetical protein
MRGVETDCLTDYCPGQLDDAGPAGVTGELYACEYEG